MSAKNMEDIAALFQKLHFRKKLIGGVDEADVWKQLDMLQNEYRAAYEALEERLGDWQARPKCCPSSQD